MSVQINKIQGGNLMKDTYNREINYLRISVTDLCNFNCEYCMPKEIEKKKHSEILRIEEIENICKIASKLGISKVRLTGGEPLVRKGILDLIHRIKNINGIKEIALTTNGSRLTNMAKDLRSAGLDRINLSLDSLDEANFERITRGHKLSDVKEGLYAAMEAGFEEIKINTVIINNINDHEIGDFINLTKENHHVRFIELMPIGKSAPFAKEHFLSAQEILSRFPELELQENSDLSSPAKYYKMPGYKFSVGLIRPISCNFCSNCNRLRLTADGKLKPCLHSDMEIDIKEIANNDVLLEQSLIKAISCKPKEHHLEDGEYIIRGMSKIGG